MSAERKSKPATPRRAMTRRAWIGAAAAGASALAVGSRQWLTANDGPRRVAGEEITVYKSPSCECCHRWVSHLRAAGFHVTTRNVSDVTPVKRQYGVPAELASCHTGVIAGFAVEGHVPADLIRRLVAERPAVAGLAVPGMPAGSPGMEGGRADRYEVLTFTRGGETTVYAAR